eukprot:5634045-Prymnesium_polylepis.1
MPHRAHAAGELSLAPHAGNLASTVTHGARRRGPKGCPKCGGHSSRTLRLYTSAGGRQTALATAPSRRGVRDPHPRPSLHGEPSCDATMTETA